MNTLILVIVLFMTALAVIAAVAFYLGWFRLASVPSDNKGMFLLMQKPEPVKQNPVSSMVHPNPLGMHSIDLPVPHQEDR